MSIDTLRPSFSRRDALRTGCSVLTGAGLTALLQHSAAATDGGGPHHKPTAKSIIFLFMEGGPSSIDLFDPKPKLNELAGETLPESFGPVITPMGEYDAPHRGLC